MLYLKNLSRSKIFQIVIVVIIILIALIFVFQAGRFVGLRQAMFSGRMGDNYYRAFEGPGRDSKMGPRGFWADNLPNGHGAVGKIIKINLPTIIVVGPDDVEKVIKIDDDTIIRRFRDTIKGGDLKVGDFIVAVGSDDNDDSQIEVKLIRLLPPPPLASTTPKQ
ncbi:MAG: hypothetical protein WC385_02610 [Candidatus Paceibacterota bacterium]|jgi:hypothetical protein